MAKPFGKLIGHYLKNKNTKEYLQVLENQRYRNSDNVGNQLVVVVQGGQQEQGTWMHEDVALHFAQWLSPEFYVWCNDRIKELLKHGMTALPQTLEDMLTNPDLVIGLATKLKEERAEKERLQQLTIEQKPYRIIKSTEEYFKALIINRSCDSNFGEKLVITNLQLNRRFYSALKMPRRLLHGI